MPVRVCFNRVGFGMEAVTMIPANTEVLFCQGNIVSSRDAKQQSDERATHCATVKCTGCTIDGSVEALFGDRERPNVGDIHQAPCRLMSLTNSSQNYKLANCKADHCENSPMKCKDGTWLNTMIWLVTIRHIQPFQELIWVSAAARLKTTGSVAGSLIA